MKELEPGLTGPVVEVLEGLVDEPRAAIALLLAEPPFEISSTVAAQLERVGQWLAVIGVRVEAQALPVPAATSWRLRVRVDRASVVKVAVSAALGLAALWLAVPEFVWAAGAMAAFTVLRTIEPRPNRLVLDSNKSGDRLEPIASRLTSELLQSRGRLTDEQIIAAVGRFLGEYVAVASILRARGDHFAGEVKASDERLQYVLRQTVLMAGEAQQLARAEVDAVSLAPDKVAKLQKRRADVIRHVDQLTASLARARGQTLGLARGQPAHALAGSIAQLAALMDRLKSEAQSW